MSYIDTLKKANPEAYKKLEGLMSYTANENKSAPQDWQAQIFTPLQVDAPKQIPIAYGQPPAGFTPNYIDLGGDGGPNLQLVNFTKDLGKVNGLPITAEYDSQGNLTGYKSDSSYRNWLNGSSGVSGRWDASGTPDPIQYNSGGGGFFGGLVGSVENVVSGGVNALGDAATWAKDNPLQAAALAAGAYYGLPALAGEGGAAAGLTGVDAAMADLAASSAPSFAGGAGATVGTGAGMLSGTDAALADLAASAPAISAPAAATGAGLMGGAATGGVNLGTATAGDLAMAVDPVAANIAAGMSPETAAAAALGTGYGAAAVGGTTLGALGTGAAAGGAGALTAAEMAKLGLVSGGLNTVGGLLQGETSKDALNQLATQQAALAEKTMQMGKFQPVGVTTRFGTSSFTTDPVTGAITPSYTLSPEAKAYQDALAGMATQGLTAGQSLMNLGQGYIGESPEAVRNRYIQTQQALLAPQQEQSLAAIRARQQATGRGGLAVGATSDGMMATNPEMAAYYNSLAQTQRQLAANAETQYQNQVNFGTGLLGQATTPFTNVFGAQKGVELAAQQPLELSTNFANTVATRGAAQGANYAQAMAPSFQAQYNAANYNPYATALQGAGSNPLTGYGLMKLTGLG